MQEQIRETLIENKHIVQRIYNAVQKGQRSLAVKVLQDYLSQQHQQYIEKIEGMNCDFCGKENTMWNNRTECFEECTGLKHELIKELNETT